MSSDLRKYCVYLITCLVNGKQYGGQTGQNPKRRFLQHKRDASKGRGATIGEAIREHGSSNFSFVILREGLTKKQADEEERLVVRTLLLQDAEFGYNVARGGSGYGLKKRKIVNDKAVAKAYLSGLSTTEVGKKFGIDNSTVGLWLRDLGIEARPAAPRKKPTPDGQIVSFYRSGVSTEEIGKMMNVSHSTVASRLKFLGEPLRPAKKELNISVERMHELHQNDIPLYQIATLAEQLRRLFEAG